MKVIYIAGKYRGPNAWAIEQNIRAAEEVAARVAAMGHMPMAVHPMTRFIGGANTDEKFWLEGTLELMRRCDAVVLVPNWRDSEGARAEVVEAMRLGLPIIYAWGDESYFYDCIQLLRTEPKVDYDEADVSQEEDHWTLTPENTR